MKFKIKYIAKEFKTSLNEGHFQNSFKQRGCPTIAFGTKKFASFWI